LLLIFWTGLKGQGQKIVFATDRDGNLEIYVMNADGSGQTNLSNNPASDIHPNWTSNNLVIDIKANGSDGPITITTTDMLTVTVSLEPGICEREIAEWYIVAYTPSPAGWHHYKPTVKPRWRPGFKLTQRGPLFDIPPRKVFEKTGLPVGEYTFFFHIGMSDGKLYSDSVKITIQ
jgi:hypothetical protein